jgi:SnoaL-like domain
VHESTIRDALVRHWHFAGIDENKVHEIYHDDAVVEFPQSGERFVGVENVRTWRLTYPAKLDFRIRRITNEGNLWVVENLISYDGGPWNFAVTILQFREDKIAHERGYVMEGFEAPPWRAEWAERFDPLESITPPEWRAEAGATEEP